jgi:hypothetical protein
MLALMEEPEYAFETRAPLDEEIRRREARARAARVEAGHAQHQPGLIGPQRNAEAAARELEADVAELREVAVRVGRGFPYWERRGFEEAVDACGDHWSWQQLAESLTRDRIYGHDEIDVRLPLGVQHAYARAAATGLFGSYEVCETYDVEGDDVVTTRSYLFAVQGFPNLGACLFFVDQWDS